MVGALENGSEHPIARAIAAAARERVGQLAALEVGAEPEAEGRRGQVPAGVHGRSRDLVAGGDLDRYRLPGEQRCVNGRAPLRDDPIRRHLLARANDEVLTHLCRFENLGTLDQQSELGTATGPDEQSGISTGRLSPVKSTGSSPRSRKADDRCGEEREADPLSDAQPQGQVGAVLADEEHEESTT